MSATYRRAAHVLTGLFPQTLTPGWAGYYMAHGLVNNIFRNQKGEKSLTWGGFAYADICFEHVEVILSLSSAFREKMKVWK